MAHEHETDGYYYVGSKTKCEAYNNKVKAQRAFVGNRGEGTGKGTKEWAEVEKHPTEDLWRIIRHTAVEANNLDLVIPDETWNEQIEP